MTDTLEKNKYQFYADILGIDANTIDDVWIDINDALIIDLADGAAIKINHSCNYSDECGDIVYSNLEVKQPTISDIDYNEHDYPISKQDGLKLLEYYFESTWGTSCEYIDSESYAAEETERDTMQSLGFTNSDFLYG